MIEGKMPASYPGVPHDFANLFPGLKISQRWRDDCDEGTRWLLQAAQTTNYVQSKL